MKRSLIVLQMTVLAVLMCAVSAAAQEPEPTREPKDQRVRTVSIPISIYTKKEMKEEQAQEYLSVERLSVLENDEEKQILSIRSVTDAPLALAILIQDDLTSNFNLQLKSLRNFIRALPKGSRVMVAYLRGGTLQIRQKFTTDMEEASDALRIVIGNPASAPRNPYDGLIDTLDRFDALPAGRRAVLMVSDGLDVSSGFDAASPSQSTDLDRAILRAQRKSVAVFTIYSPATHTRDRNQRLVSFGQGSLLKLADATGGRAFFSGTDAPVSFEPFLRPLKILLNRQFLLTYLTSNMKKGYYRVEVRSTNPEVKIEHPKGYYYRQ